MAAATPWGRSALAVVRLTGDDLAPVLDRILRPMRRGPLEAGRPRRIEVFDDDGVFDDGVAILLRGPHTATGHDLCEITVHGNPLIVHRLVDAAVAAGARVAQPGEFTRLAVLSGRLDLLRAEAIDQVIRATSPGGLRLGRLGLTGILSERIAPLRQGLVELTAELEARLDYPGDELALADDAALLTQLSEVAAGCRRLASGHTAGRVLVDGARIALVGAVNAGKSSLFNRLVGQPRALVHDSPGTTRDVVEARCWIGPLQVTLLDTAGERQTSDPIEAAGLALALALIEDVDVLIVVLRAGAGGATRAVEEAVLARTADRRRVIVYNGVDRSSGEPPPGAIPTSALTGAGLQDLREALIASLGIGDRADALIASARQRDLLLQVARAAEEAAEALPLAGVAVAADLLTDGIAGLDTLTGADTREDVLDAVFARFCVGK